MRESLFTCSILRECLPVGSNLEMLKSLQGLCKTASTANSMFRIIYARCYVLHRLFLRKQYLIIVDNYSCQLGDSILVRRL